MCVCEVINLIKIKLKNIGILQKADIMLNGLTVISGLNNTGKSTVGKILFSVFHGAKSYKQDFPRAAIDYLAEDFLGLFTATVKKDDTHSSRKLYSYQTALEYGVKGIKEYVNQDFSYVPDKRKKFVQSKISSLKDKLEQINSPDFEFDVFFNTIGETFRKELGRNSKNVFADENEIGKVQIIHDNGEDILLKLTSNGIMLLKSDFSKLKNNTLFSEVNYIETPFIIDEMDSFHNIFEYRLLPSITSHKEAMLYKMVARNSAENVIKATLRNERIAALSKEIANVLPGSIEYRNRFVYKHDGHVFDLSTLATGMKSYAILQLLLQNGYLPEKSLLIIDEPEIHLHPAWQLLYAEMLVLMVKKLNIYLVIATHSPYFLQALDIFQERHKLGDKAHFYLAESHEKGAIISNIDGNLDKSYNLMAEPILTLRKYRDEMQEQDDDNS